MFILFWCKLASCELSLFCILPKFTFLAVFLEFLSKLLLRLVGCILQQLDHYRYLGLCWFFILKIFLKCVWCCIWELTKCLIRELLTTDYRTLSSRISHFDILNSGDIEFFILTCQILEISNYSLWHIVFYRYRILDFSNSWLL